MNHAHQVVPDGVLTSGLLRRDWTEPTVDTTRYQYVP